jgi:hypothetical protein
VDNEYGVFFSNEDSGYGALNNLTSRKVFTQLVSSNKQDVSVPIYDQVNPYFDIYEGPANQKQDELGEIHEYSMGYINDRFVKDLGSEFFSSYAFC